MPYAYHGKHGVGVLPLGTHTHTTYIYLSCVRARARVLPRLHANIAYIIPLHDDTIARYTLLTIEIGK